MSKRAPTFSYAQMRAEKIERGRAELADIDLLGLLDLPPKASTRRKLPSLPVSRLTGGQSGTLRKRGQYYYVQFRSRPGANGKIKQLCRRVGRIADMTEAQARETMVGIVEREVPRVPVAGEACPWLGWCARYLRIYVEVQRTGTLRTTKSIIKQHLAPAFQDLQLHEINTGLIASLLAEWVRDGAARDTIRQRYRVLRRMLRKADLEGWRVAQIGHIDLPRSSTVRTRRGSRAFTTEEVSRIIGDAGPMLRLLCSFFAFMALRTGEALGIRWADVDLDAAKLFLVRQYQHGQDVAPKTSSSSEDMPIPEQLLSQLREWRARRPATHVYVFQSHKSVRPFDDSGLRKHHFRPVLKRLGIPDGRSFHAFRHWFGTQSVLGGATVLQVQRALRHADVRTTQQYFNVDRVEGEAAQAAAMSRYSQFVEGLLSGHDQRNDAVPPESSPAQQLARGSADDDGNS